MEEYEVAVNMQGEIPDIFKRKPGALREISYHSLLRSNLSSTDKDFIAQECIPPNGRKFASSQEHLKIDPFSDDELLTDSGAVTFSKTTSAVASRYNIPMRRLKFWIKTRKDNRLVVFIYIYYIICNIHIYIS